eukprot:975128_1
MDKITYLIQQKNHQFGYEYSGNYHRFNIYSGTSPSFYAYITYYPGSLEIFLSHSYFPNKVCGLCGLFDNDHTNELLGSDGKQYLPADITTISYPYYGRVRLSRTVAIDSIVNDFSSTYVYFPPTLSPTSLTTPPTLTPTKSPLTSAPTKSPLTSAPTKSPLTSAPTFTKNPTSN